MKPIYLFLTVLLLISCSKSDADSVKTIENAIGTPIYSYENINYKDISNTGYPVEVIDITFSKPDFEEIIQKIDLKKYKKEDNNYYRDFASDTISWHLAIFSREKKIRYSTANYDSEKKD